MSKVIRADDREVSAELAKARRAGHHHRTVMKKMRRVEVGNMWLNVEELLHQAAALEFRRASTAWSRRDTEKLSSEQQKQVVTTLIDSICELVSHGMLVTHALDEAQVSPRQWFAWLRNNESEASAKYALAFDCFLSYMADRTLELADTASEDTVQLHQMRIKIRQWWLERLDPRFTPRQTVDANITTRSISQELSVTMSAQEAMEMYTRMIQEVE